jgi:hypothetical protein
LILVNHEIMIHYQPVRQMLYQEEATQLVARRPSHRMRQLRQYHNVPGPRKDEIATTRQVEVKQTTFLIAGSRSLDLGNIATGMTVTETRHLTHARHHPQRAAAAVANPPQGPKTSNLMLVQV